MTEHLAILKDIIQLLKVDYAGCSDKAGALKEAFFLQQLATAEANGPIEDFDFYLLVRDLLMPYKDKHLQFYCLDRDKRLSYDVGFKVQRFEKELFVIAVTAANTMRQVGDRISHIDGRSIAEMAMTNGVFNDNHYWERQDWSTLLLRGKSYGGITVDGIVYESTVVPHISGYSEKPYTYQTLDEKIGLLRLPHFFSPEKMASFLSEHRASIDQQTKLIIDLRGNPGGTDAAFYPLLAYCFDGQHQLGDLDQELLEFNMTARNHALRLPKLLNALEASGTPELRQYYEKFIAAMTTHQNAGLVTIDFHHEVEAIWIQGNSQISRVILLSDCETASSAEAFIRIAVKSEKVSLMGRSTAGALDYSNLAEQCYDQRFSLKYPTSRSKYIDFGQGVDQTGILPDIHVRWTPQHFNQDMDLKMALECLNEAGH